MGTRLPGGSGHGDPAYVRMHRFHRCRRHLCRSVVHQCILRPGHGDRPLLDGEASLHGGDEIVRSGHPVHVGGYGVLAHVGVPDVIVLQHDRSAEHRFGIAVDESGVVVSSVLRGLAVVDSVVPDGEGQLLLAYGQGAVDGLEHVIRRGKPGNDRYNLVIACSVADRVCVTECYRTGDLLRPRLSRHQRGVSVASVGRRIAVIDAVVLRCDVYRSGKYGGGGRHGCGDLIVAAGGREFRSYRNSAVGYVRHAAVVSHLYSDTIGSGRQRPSDGGSVDESVVCP